MAIKEAQVIDAEFTDINDPETHHKPSNQGLFRDLADVMDHASEPISIFDPEKAKRAREIAGALRATADDAIEAKEAAMRLVDKSKSILSKLGIGSNHDRQVHNLERK